MSLYFPPSWLDDLRQRADIIQIVSAYLPLKKRGSNYVGLCPFHHEKTPSFTVNEQKQLYYCFGCKAGGSVIQFVMDMERMDFQEAVKHLAEQLNMTIPEERPPSKEYIAKKNQRENIYAINKMAAHFYHDNLWKKSGLLTLSYLQERKIEDRTIIKFGLGAATSGWTDLTDYLVKEGFELRDIELAGLCKIKENRYYDIFRNRAIFPIIDGFGKVIGFGGRAMGTTQPKYLNTSDTPAFNKRFNVYGINLLKQIRNLPYIILVEGYMDVISLNQHRIECAVATLGTSLTLEQANLLRRYSPNIWIAYDSDYAGQEASLRAIETLKEAGIDAKVLNFPEGMDPDDFLNQFGGEAFRELSPIRALTFRLNHLKKGYNLSEEPQRIEYAKKGAQLLADVTSPVELDSYLKQLSITTGFNKDILLAQVGHILPKNINKLYAKKKTSQAPLKSSFSAFEKAEQLLLAIYAQKLLPESLFTRREFSTPLALQAYEELKKGNSIAYILELQQDNEQKKYLLDAFSIDLPDQPDELLYMVEDCIRKIKQNRLETEIINLTKKLDKAQSLSNTEILKQISDLREQLKDSTP